MSKSLMAVLFAAALLSGCASLENLAKPYDEVKDDPNVASTIRFVNFAGKLGCTVIVQEGSEQDVANTSLALGYAKAVLASDVPTVKAVEVALSVTLPEQGKPYAALALEEIRAQFGEMLVDKNSAAFVAVTSFIDGCSFAIEQTGSTTL